MQETFEGDVAAIDRFFVRGAQAGACVNQLIKIQGGVLLQALQDWGKLFLNRPQTATGSARQAATRV